jgi:hypothetical protein
MVICALPLLVSCGGGGGGGNTQVDPVVLAAVSALFPANGTDWNDYIEGSEIASATDTACTAGGLACLHGGELRVVAATGKASCAGLTASDALAAFDWECDGSTNPVRLVSTGLADGANLSDLIDFGTAAFKANQLTVFENGVAWGVSASTVWWSNPLAIDNDGGTLATASTIYLVTGNPAASYTIGADRVGLVIQPGATLSGPGTSPAVISLNNSLNDFGYFWLEGAIDGSVHDHAVILTQARFSTLRNVSTSNGDTGIELSGGTRNRLVRVAASNHLINGILLSNNFNNSSLSDLSARNNDVCGVALDTAFNNTLTSVTVADNGIAGSESGGVCLNHAFNNRLSGVIANHNAGHGIWLHVDGAGVATSSNTLSNVTANNNLQTGISADGSSDNNWFFDVTTSNNGSAGIELNNASGNTIMRLTSSNNGNSGVSLSGASGNLLTNVAAGNNGFAGITIFSGGNNTLSDVVMGNNGDHSIHLSNTSDNQFAGMLKVGSNVTDCNVTGGTNPGLVHGTCANDGTSTATLSLGITLATSFVAKVSVNDVRNMSDMNGTADFSAVGPAFDWTRFDNSYRGWGPDGSAFPNADHRRRWASGTGRIWDWSVSALDTALLGVLAVPDGNATLTHSFIGGPSTFLRHAIEIAGDGIGNDNLRCESNETCLYTPNIGSYQGHGTLISAGTFTNGALTGITLMRYATNGR